MNIVHQSFRKNRLLYLIIFLAAISVQLAVLGGFHFYCKSLLSGGMSPVWAGRKGMVMLSLGETVFYLLSLPLILFSLFPAYTGTLQRDLLIILPGRQSIRRKEMFNAVVLVIVLILPVIIPAVYLHTWHVPAGMIVRFALTLSVIVLSFTALIHFVHTLFRNTFTSTAAAYICVLFLTGGIILMNPVIEWTDNPEGIIQSVLLLNPVIAVASSIDLDILRTDPLYYLSSISAYNFRYPGSVQVGLFHGFMFFVLFIMKGMFSDKS